MGKDVAKVIQRIEGIGPDGCEGSAEGAERAGSVGIEGIRDVNFNSRFGKLLPEELEEYLKESVEGAREEPFQERAGLTPEQVKLEAVRCLHCDCRAKDDCSLRDLSDEYKANQKHYWSENRKKVTKQIQHEFVVFEESKCIKCGRCVHISAESKEKYGMSFIGRGFDVVVGVPFGEGLDEGLRLVAEEVVKECPTGALSSSRELGK